MHMKPVAVRLITRNRPMLPTNVRCYANIAYLIIGFNDQPSKRPTKNSFFYQTNLIDGWKLYSGNVANMLESL